MKKKLEKIAEWINNNMEYRQRYFNENPEFKKIMENIEREERRRFNYNNLMGRRMMDSSWVKLGWSFEEAMTALHERLTQNCHRHEYMFLKLCEGVYLIKSGRSVPATWIMGNFANVYGKYSVCFFKGDYRLYAADPEKCMFQIFTLLSDHRKNVEEGASINDL